MSAMIIKISFDGGTSMTLPAKDAENAQKIMDNLYREKARAYPAVLVKQDEGIWTVIDVQKMVCAVMYPKGLEKGL